MTVQIMHGDCRDVLRTLPAGSFDACIADPPYGDTSLDWDQVVPGWITAVARVLKPAASVWVFGSMRFLAPLFAEFDSEGFRYSQDIVWEKQNGTGFHADRFRRVHEHAVMFYRGAWSDVYHAPQFVGEHRRAQRIKRGRTPHVDSIGADGEIAGQRLERSVIFVPNEHGKAVHPTQKPLGIIAPLVRYSVPPGGSYVVPFAGSGSECLVGLIDGLDVVGVELDAENIDIAQRRIQGDAPLFAEVA